jgi:hypothetical protein
MSDENGNPRAYITVLKGWPVLGLWDEKGKGGIALTASPDGPGLVLRDENGKTIWRAP